MRARTEIAHATPRLLYEAMVRVACAAAAAAAAALSSCGLRAQLAPTILLELVAADCASMAAWRLDPAHIEGFTRLVDIVERAKATTPPLAPSATTTSNARPSIVAGNDHRLNEFEAIINESDMATVFKCCDTVGGKDFIHCSNDKCTIGWWHRCDSVRCC